MSRTTHYSLQLISTMPTVSAPSNILVTGANGYLGLWIVRALLERGYSVKGTVRSPAIADTIKRFVQDKYPQQAAKFGCVVVPDITIDGAFDDAVTDVTAVIHTASPVLLAEADPEACIKPAVGGTVSILRSVQKHGTHVKRVIITSSIAAVFNTYGPSGLQTEEMWNDDAVKTVREQGRDAPGDLKYAASKTLSERAAWGFVRDHKEDIKFDLCTVLPSWVMGPIPRDLSSPLQMSSSPRHLYDQLFTVPAPSPREPRFFNYVDVYDVIDAHIRALEVEAAGGERILVSSHVCSWQDWRTSSCVILRRIWLTLLHTVDAANALGVLPKLDKEDHDAAGDVPSYPTSSNEKAKRILGIKFKTLPETFKEVYEQWSVLGWLAHLEA
ncbi:NAD-P-binding protein [Cubamyces sp. BRFM 1775]|nr:NAD-P-binding protein [Cubamyces sp. BRFM 1775]